MPLTTNNAELLANKVGFDYCSSVFDGYVYAESGTLVFKDMSISVAS